MEQVLAGPVRDPRAAALLRRYHERFGGSLQPPVPIEAIAEDLLGLSVAESESLDVSGMLLPAEREVWLNATESSERRRFTLAHEVGHWVCQVLEGRGAQVMCRADEVGVEEGRALEREANVFAAELLMPEELVRRAWQDDADSAAVRFGVSGEAMGWRLYNVGLVAERPKPAQSAQA
jgi:Zn-dependent peptidase ImmA (M78 family)